MRKNVVNGPKAPAAAPQPAPKLKLELDLNSVNVILAHLGQGAFQNVAPVIEDIRNQVVPQVAAGAA